MQVLDGKASGQNALLEALKEKQNLTGGE